MLFTGSGRPLQEVELPCSRTGPGQLLLEVSACGVCRTDLHIVDGEAALALADADGVAALLRW